MARIAIVVVSDSLASHALRYGTPATEVIEDPLPDDARLVAVDYDGRAIRLKFASEAFDEVPEGGEIPIVNPGFKRLQDK